MVTVPAFRRLDRHGAMELLQAEFVQAVGLVERLRSHCVIDTTLAELAALQTQGVQYPPSTRRYGIAHLDLRSGSTCFGHPRSLAEERSFDATAVARTSIALGPHPLLLAGEHILRIQRQLAQRIERHQGNGAKRQYMSAIATPREQNRQQQQQ